MRKVYKWPGRDRDGAQGNGSQHSHQGWSSTQHSSTQRWAQSSSFLLCVLQTRCRSDFSPLGVAGVPWSPECEESAEGQCGWCASLLFIPGNPLQESALLSEATSALIIVKTKLCIELKWWWSRGLSWQGEWLAKRGEVFICPAHGKRLHCIFPDTQALAALEPRPLGVFPLPLPHSKAPRSVSSPSSLSLHFFPTSSLMVFTSREREDKQLPPSCSQGSSGNFEKWKVEM